MKVRLIGIGNPGRQDDGLGAALVDEIDKAKKGAISNVEAVWKYQLNIEDAGLIKDRDYVVFADATTEVDAPARLAEIAPASEIAFTTHALAPESVLALSEELYGRAPKAYVLAIRGYAWDIGEGLSPQASANLTSAVSLLADFLKLRES